MTFSTHTLILHPSERMKRLVIRLYMKHAKFFCHFMTWYLSPSSKRLVTTLRNDFYTKEVQQRVAEIRSVVKEIEQEASLITQTSVQRTEASVQSLGLSVEEFARRADFYHNMDTGHFETIVNYLKIIAGCVGQLCQKNLVDNCENLFYKADVAGRIGEYLNTSHVLL